MILVIDNYDSFVYNLVCYIEMLGYKTHVVRNDQITLDEIAKLPISHIIISPGPGTPEQAGICVELIKRFGGVVPILGVCLGHQAIAVAYGGQVVRSIEPLHGRASLVEHNEQGLFENLSNPLRVARYHSLIVSRDHLPACLTVTATSQQGEIMALSHKQYPVTGVQFHPESILTQSGHGLLTKFLEVCVDGVVVA